MQGKTQSYKETVGGTVSQKGHPSSSAQPGKSKVTSYSISQCKSTVFYHLK